MYFNKKIIFIFKLEMLFKRLAFILYLSHICSLESYTKQCPNMCKQEDKSVPLLLSRRQTTLQGGKTEEDKQNDRMIHQRNQLKYKYNPCLPFQVLSFPVSRQQITSIAMNEQAPASSQPFLESNILTFSETTWEAVSTILADTKLYYCIFIFILYDEMFFFI